VVALVEKLTIFDGDHLPRPDKSNIRGKYLALCLPMYRDITFETWDFVDQVRALTPPTGWEPINVQPGKSHPVFVTRESIVEQLLKLEKAAGIEHEILLWCDSDCGLTVPAHAWALVERLHAAPPSIGILGVPCRMRGFQENDANVSHFAGRNLYDLDHGVVLPSHESTASPGCPFILADAIGFGVVAMRASIFRVLPRPWFDFRWAPTLDQTLSIPQRLVGEDLGFCRRVRKELRLQTAVDYSIRAWHLVEHRAEFPEGALLPFSPAAGWKRGAE